VPERTLRTIADIGKERVRRVIQGIARGDAENAEKEKSPDLFSSVNSAPPRDTPPYLGFRVFKLAESNFKPWNAEAPHDVESLAQQLELHIDHIRDGRTAEDLLYEILLKSGFPLTTPVEVIRIARGDAESADQKKRPDLNPSADSAAPRESFLVYSVAGGALFICLERDLTLGLIRAMSEKRPERVVCLDEGFAGNDQLKANAVQIFKTRGVTNFKTV
jgi:adenine-specific DNA-methyltransferase